MHYKAEFHNTYQTQLINVSKNISIRRFMFINAFLVLKKLIGIIGGGGGGGLSIFIKEKKHVFV